MASKNRPTHGKPLTEAEKAAPRGADAGQKNWQGGPRFERIKRGGIYTSRTGNSNGQKKPRSPTFKKGQKPPFGTERPVKRVTLSKEK